MKGMSKYPISSPSGIENIIMYTCVNENAIPFYEKIGMTRPSDVMVYNRVEWTDFTVE